MQIRRRWQLVATMHYYPDMGSREPKPEQLKIKNRESAKLNLKSMVMTGWNREKLLVNNLEEL